MARPTLIALNVGNTRTQLGRFEDDKLAQSERLANDDLPAIVERVVGWWDCRDEAHPALVVVASVNDTVGEQLKSMIADQLSTNVYIVGKDLPIPIGESLDPETITGVDRLLNAAAAYATLEQACVVVDAGTAITVDFVDGEGTFHGGAIAPGASMQLAALHQHTSALPALEFTKPDSEAFGKSTAQAMLHGVYDGIRGLVWRLVEKYAERYGAYPMVVVTGGDANVLFEDDELVNRLVPDLTLLGIAAAARHALASEPE